MTLLKWHPLSKNPDSPDWIIGYTTRDHLCVDLDNTSINKVFCLVKMIMRDFPYVGNAVVVESSSRRLFVKWNYPPCSNPLVRSSRSNFHAVFDNWISYEESCHIIETLARLDVINTEYIRIREMRNDMTLRVSKSVLMDATKLPPIPLVFVINPWISRHDGAILYYLRFLAICHSL